MSTVDVKLNRFGVGALGDRVVMLLRTNGPLTTGEVRCLVAWLIVVSRIKLDDVADDVRAIERGS